MGAQERLSGDKVKRRLDGAQYLLTPYKDRIGTWDGVPVSDMGAIFRFSNVTPRPGADWLMLDFDGTLAATDQLKAKRADGYRKYARNQGVMVSDHVLDGIMQTTYEFSKWAQRAGASTVVHAGAQMGALTWATDQLTKGVSVDTISDTLTRVHRQLDGEKKS